MIHLGQIEKNQYSLKREKFRNQNDGAYHSVSYTQNHLYNIQSKPLQRGVKSQVSFKGFGFNILREAFRPAIKPIPTKLTKKVFVSLKNISTVQYEYYKQVIKDYVNFIKIHKTPPKDEAEKLLREAGANFRKRNFIPDEVAENITESNLYYLPQKTIPSLFIEKIIAPFKFISNSLKKIFIPQSRKVEVQKAKERRILKDFAALQGLINSHEIWENGYRKLSGNKKWTPASEFIIPNDILLSKIQRRRNKIVDPNKGKYSSTSMMLGNRFISGLIYSYFLGTDAYNTTMRYSNDEKEASAQRTSRVLQEFSRIGMNMYVQNILFGTFEAAVNRSLATAMFVSGSTVAFSEVLGRKLVGKPILPSDKETLDRLEKEMNEKKGIMPAIGRLLTNVKKKDIPQQKNFATATLSNSYEKTPANTSLFSSFTNKTETKDIVRNSNSPSFKGYYKIDNLVDKKSLLALLKIIEKADEKRAAVIKEIILKSTNRSGYYSKINVDRPQTFEEIVQCTSADKIPIGKNKTIWGLWTSSLLVPVKFLTNTVKSAVNKSQKLISYVLGKKNNTLAKELEDLKKRGGTEAAEFKKYFEERKKLSAWKNSELNNEEKELRIYSEFMSIKGKDKEDIEGVKNILLWIEKQLKRENIKIDENGNIPEEDVEKVKKLLMDSVLKADSAKHVEYDGNTLAQTNINLSRAITTLFLMTDAYNLTMQYSNDNKKDANKSAKNRAAQEISRIGVSAYILAFVHNLLSKLCNSSLAGAFTLTALTSTINDSISRQVVGVPLRAKNQKQLQEIDQENAKSKSPIKKALAYSIGKKSALPQPAQETNVALTDNDSYYLKDYFITPKIS